MGTNRDFGEIVGGISSSAIIHIKHEVVRVGVWIVSSDNLEFRLRSSLKTVDGRSLRCPTDELSVANTYCFGAGIPSNAANTKFG